MAERPNIPCLECGASEGERHHPACVGWLKLLIATAEPDGMTLRQRAHAQLEGLGPELAYRLVYTVGLLREVLRQAEVFDEMREQDGVPRDSFTAALRRAHEAVIVPNTGKRLTGKPGTGTVEEPQEGVLREEPQPTQVQHSEEVADA